MKIEQHGEMPSQNIEIPGVEISEPIRQRIDVPENLLPEDFGYGDSGFAVSERVPVQQSPPQITRDFVLSQNCDGSLKLTERITSSVEVIIQIQF